MLKGIVLAFALCIIGCALGEEKYDLNTFDSSSLSDVLLEFVDGPANKAGLKSEHNFWCEVRHQELYSEAFDNARILVKASCIEDTELRYAFRMRSYYSKAVKILQRVDNVNISSICLVGPLNTVEVSKILKEMLPNDIRASPSIII